MSDELPFISDRYQVVHPLGRGGMATVYLARDAKYERDVAIKVLEAEVSGRAMIDRFLHEISVAARLTHPHIVPLLDSGATDGRLWFAMPVLDGQSLRERLDAERQLPIGDAVRIACEVASALGYAHAHGVVHRDIKPENVLLSRGTVAVADFGLAKGLAESNPSARLTATGTVVGTAYYMSPEQATGSDVVDGRSDIYSLGCLVYEMLAGEPPYAGNTMRLVIAKHFADPVPSARRLRPTIPPAVDDVLKKSLAKDPVDRFQSAEEFASALMKAAGSDPMAASQVKPALAVSDNRRHRRRWLAGVAAGVLLVAAVAGLVWMRSAAAARRAPRSIAVLPFANLSDDKSQEYFSAGMTDELLGALSGIKQLRVAARASSYAASRNTTDVGEIGRKLKVEAVLGGTVRRSGDEVKISAELVNVSDGFSIWSHTYSRKLTDVFALQEEIARAIVAAIQLQLGDGRAIVQRGTADADAYDSYLRGRHALDARSAASIDTAAEYFREAVDRDPRYARAWSGMADAFIFQGLNYYAPPASAFPKAKAAAMRALSIDSTLAEALTSLATVEYLYDRDFDRAAATYDRAIALDPSYPQSHYFYSILLTDRDAPRAEAEAAKARELDPLSPPMAQALGMARVGDAKYAEAVPTLREAIALEPNYYFPHAWLSLALARTGAGKEAIAEAQRAIALNPSNTLTMSYLAEVYALEGDRSAALATVAKIDSLSATRPVCAVYVARVFDRLKDADAVMQWLQRAEKAHEGQLAQLLRPDAFPNTRTDARFQRMVKRLGLTR